MSQKLFGVWYMVLEKNKENKEKLPTSKIVGTGIIRTDLRISQQLYSFM